MLTLFLVSRVPTQVGEKFTLDGDEGHHAAKVLRIGVDEEVLLGDGRGSWAKASVLAAGKKSLDLTVLESGFQKASHIAMSVVQAIPKGDRAKEAMELLTEAGADRIIPWQAARSIGKAQDGVEKFEKTAREASKQSRRLWMPEVANVASTSNVVDEVRLADLAIVFHESATQKISDVLQKFENISSVLIVIGPEGGLTDDEIKLFSGAGASVVLMGRPVLRSAHAGIAAIAAVCTGLRIW